MYEANIGKPPESSAAGSHNYREKMAKWRDIGLDVDELADRLQYDADRFRSRGGCSVPGWTGSSPNGTGDQETEARSASRRPGEDSVRDEGGRRRTFHRLSLSSWTRRYWHRCWARWPEGQIVRQATGAWPLWRYDVDQ
jgi:hypothetical protein